MHKLGIARVATGLVVGLTVFCSLAFGDKQVSLMDAARKGDMKQVQDFIEKGADVNARDELGMTALMWASLYGHSDVARLLLEKRADGNFKNNNGVTALMWACTYGHADAARLLLDKGVEVNAKDSNGSTALVRASISGDVEVVSLILKKRVDVNAEDQQGRTALDFAWKEGHKKVEQILKAHAAHGTQSVYERDGNIFLRNRQGTEIQLTSSGQDCDPSLSQDGAHVVFVRETSEAPIDAGVGDAPATELWVVDVGDRQARRVLGSKASDKMEEVLAAFGHPQFSPDSSSIYFLSAAWATSHAVHKLDLISKKESFISSGNTLEVIREGAHKGYLKVYKHKYGEDGAYDCEYLLTPDGKEIKAIEPECPGISD